MLLHRGRRPSAFTLIELLIVMGIIAMLVGLLLPAVQKVRESAYRAQCTNNLKQLGIAFQSYHSTAGAFPPSVIRWDTTVSPQIGSTPGSNGWATWAVMILPHIDQDNAFHEWTITQRFGEPTQAKGRAVALPYLFCPSRRSPVGLADYNPSGYDGGLRSALSDYVVCDGNLLNLPGATSSDPYGGDGGGAIIAAESNLPSRAVALQSWKSRTKISTIQRGVSNTLMLGEKHIALGIAIGEGPYWDNSVFNGAHQDDGIAAGSWSKCVGQFNSSSPVIGLQNNPNCRTSECKRSFGSAHQTGVNFAFCDGSVRMASFSTDARAGGVLDQLARRAKYPNEAPITPDF